MTPKEKIVKITGLFGMKAAVASQAMGISISTYRNKLCEKAKYYEFNEIDLANLKKYIKEVSLVVEKL